MESLATTEDETDTMTSLTEVLSTIQTGKFFCILQLKIRPSAKKRVQKCGICRKRYVSCCKLLFYLSKINEDQ